MTGAGFRFSLDARAICGSLVVLALGFLGEIGGRVGGQDFCGCLGGPVFFSWSTTSLSCGVSGFPFSMLPRSDTPALLCQIFLPAGVIEVEDGPGLAGALSGDEISLNARYTAFVGSSFSTVAGGSGG